MASYKLWIFGILQFLLFIKNSIADSDLLVTLPEGQIVGVKSKSSVTNSTTEFYSFYALRYAEPPVGELRFKSPQPIQPWSGIYDATAQRSICYQVSGDFIEESEDCLYLNVFSPINPSLIDDGTKLLPVIFVIHGGGFVSGSGQTSNSSVGIWSPDFFMDYGVVMVAINYRLGPFGFFSTGDEVIPGNMGLKDQNLALKWVKDRIHLFGGDGNNIVIIGPSAGSASVAFQVLSPKSKGLFKGGICESGVAISPWAYQRNQTDITYTTAGLIDERWNNVNSRNSTELLNFLISVPASEIDTASAQYSNNETLEDQQIAQGFFYGPVIEVDHADAFLTELMYESLQSGNFNKVPLLIGMNAEEAEQFYNEDMGSTVLEFQQYPELLVPHDMHLEGKNISLVGNLIKEQYMGDGPVTNASLAKTIKFFSDQCFARSIIKQAELQSKYSDVFFYVFSHHGYMGGNKVSFPGTDNVTHGEELSYIYAKYIESDIPNQWIMTSDLTQFSQIDLNVHYRFMRLWTNFAKYLNPTPNEDEMLQNVIWPKVNVQNEADFQYLDIGENLSIKTNPRGDLFKFWKKLYEDYAVPPLDTF